MKLLFAELCSILFFKLFVNLCLFRRVNGWPIYAKGSNLIPLDVLLERVTSAKIRSLMLSSKEANMNMLRIWGGGIYELDEVYEAADEYGILIWQVPRYSTSHEISMIPNLTSYRLQESYIRPLVSHSFTSFVRFEQPFQKFYKVTIQSNTVRPLSCPCSRPHGVD